VTSSDTGGDTRRQHDEPGVAEQPARLVVPAADQSAPSSSTTLASASPAKASAAVPAASETQDASAAPTSSRLADLAQAAQTVIRISSQSGATQARITLQPETLGTVEIHLSYGPGGVSATIHTDNPQAAQTLTQAAPDLRRALENQGLSLLDLDVRDRSSQYTAGGNAGRGGGSESGDDEPEEGDELTATPIDAGDPLQAQTQIDVFA
jgi:flagellar hook-length control protein FliK